MNNMGFLRVRRWNLSFAYGLLRRVLSNFTFSQFQKKEGEVGVEKFMKKVVICPENYANLDNLGWLWKILASQRNIFIK